MARNTIGNLEETMSTTHSRGGQATTTTPALVSAHSASVATLRSRLKALSASNYTDAKLDDMTRNDMLYALRVISAPTDIK